MQIKRSERVVSETTAALRPRHLSRRRIVSASALLTVLTVVLLLRSQGTPTSPAMLVSFTALVLTAGRHGARAAAHRARGLFHGPTTTLAGHASGPHHVHHTGR